MQRGAGRSAGVVVTPILARVGQVPPWAFSFNSPFQMDGRHLRAASRHLRAAIRRSRPVSSGKPSAGGVPRSDL